MGSIAATTFIANIRTNLSEPIDSSQNEVATAGNEWTQSELLEYLNKAKDRLWDIIRKVREDYFVTVGASLTIAANTKKHNLAAGFRQLTAIKITSSGYEDITFRSLDQTTDEWKKRDAVALNDTDETGIFYYDIVEEGGTHKLLLCNFPTRAYTAEYNYVGVLADFTLSASSTLALNDELREFLEGYATWLALAKKPTDPRLGFWKDHLFSPNAQVNLHQRVIDSVSKRQIRDPKYVEPYDPHRY